MKLENYLDYLVTFLQKTVEAAKAKGLVVGLSGGVDSAVAAKLIQRAFPENHLTVWMPLQSSELDEKCCFELVATANLNNVKVDLTDSYNSLASSFEKASTKISPLSWANTKARLRMTTLYALAQSNDYLVVGTDNADEWHIGYFTKYGDGAVDLLPLIYLLKGEIRTAAKILNVPQSIIDRAPTASLWENQTDEAEIGFSYDLIDKYLLGDRSNLQLNHRVEELNQRSEHKRQPPLKPAKYVRD